MHSVFEHITSFTDWFITFGLFAALYVVVRFILNRQARGKRSNALVRQFILFGIVIVGLIAVILAFPMGDHTRSQITGLIGIVVSAVLALSSATFIGNGLAGIMMRIVDNFRTGDFVTVGDYFGRITERGLFHTELQMIDSDLITFPNLYFVNNPVKVTHSDGTFISSEVSLGYDVNHNKVEKALIEGALNCGLKDPFVHITALNDFSVGYKVFGSLANVKSILTTSSSLRKAVLDSLHEHKIEIVSPTFMNTRDVKRSVFIPKDYHEEHDLEKADHPEELIFEKAELAESIEKLGERLEEVDKDISAIKELMGKGSKEEKEKLKKKVESLKILKERIVALIDKKKEEE